MNSSGCFHLKPEPGPVRAGGRGWAVRRRRATEPYLSRVPTAGIDLVPAVTYFQVFSNPAANAGGQFVGFPWPSSTNGEQRPRVRDKNLIAQLITDLPSSVKGTPAGAIAGPVPRRCSGQFVLAAVGPLSVVHTVGGSSVSPGAHVGPGAPWLRRHARTRERSRRGRRFGGRHRFYWARRKRPAHQA